MKDMKQHKNGIGLEKLGPKFYGRINEKTTEEIYKNDAESIELTANFSSIIPGERDYIIASPVPSTAALPLLVWETSDPNIAGISSEGLVFAESEGDVTITATPTNPNITGATITIHIGASDIPEPEVPGDNEIWYTTASGEILDKDFTETQFFGDDLALTSHTHEDGLGKVVFSGNVTRCFLDCEDLKDVYLPETANEIYMIAGNDNLKGIYIYSKTAYSAIDDDGSPIVPMFGNEEYTGYKVYVPAESLEAYKTAWPGYAVQGLILPLPE